MYSHCPYLYHKLKVAHIWTWLLWARTTSTTTSTSAANKEVEKADVQHRKKRGTYPHYDDEIWAKIAKC